MARLAVEEVAAVLVTRGGRDISPIVDALPFPEVVVWDNSGAITRRRTSPWPAGDDLPTAAKTENLGAFGRYCAIDFVAAPVCYTQDDDAFVAREDIERLLDAYEPGVVTALMPSSRVDYQDTVLLGWGAIFDRALPMAAFNRWVAAGHEIESEDFRVVGADFVFPLLTPHKRLAGEHVNLPWAHDDDRTWSRPGYAETKAWFMREARRIRDGAK